MKESTSKAGDVSRPLVRYYVAVSLDGFIAPLDGSVEWFEQARAGDGPSGQPGLGYAEFVEQIGGLILGRDTFETELGFGPWSYDAIPAVVMTHRPIPSPPSNVVAASGDPVTALEALKKRVQRGDIWLLGGGVLAGQLLDAGAIDTIEMSILPISLGSGRTLFGGRAIGRIFNREETRADKGITTMVLRPRPPQRKSS